jgi:polo-like kinase 1
MITERIKGNGIDTAESYRKYSLGQLLGKGGFAKVFEVTDVSTGNAYAAKVIDKKSLMKPKTKQKLLTEIKIHKSLNHSGVVKFVHFFDDEENVYILLEVCHCRSLMELMKNKQRLSEMESKFLMLQILNAVQYMHENRVIHRDLKLGNLFLTEDMQIKIGDFGLAAQLDYDGQRKRTVCGTPNYIAPEILQNMGHSYEVDVWSIGVILYTMLVGTPPFETSNVKSTYRKIKANIYTFPDGIYVSETAKSLIRRILNQDPSQRPTIPEILNDKFFYGEIPSLVGNRSQIPASLKQYASIYSTAPKLQQQQQQKTATTTAPATSTPVTRAPFQNIQNTIAEKVAPNSAERPSSAKKASMSRPTYNPYSKLGSKYSSRPSASALSGPKRYSSENMMVDAGTTSKRTDIYSSPPQEDHYASPSRARPMLTSTATTATTATTTRKSSPPTTTADDDDCNLTSMHDTLNQNFANVQQRTRMTDSSPSVSVHSPQQSDMMDIQSNHQIQQQQQQPVQHVDLMEEDDEDEEICDPDIWVSQWADFSSKYGLAYKLNNGFVGAHYNDSTKLMWRTNLSQVDYMERKRSTTGSYDERITYSEADYPDTLNKKMTLIKYFKSYLENQLKGNTKDNVVKGGGDGGACIFSEVVVPSDSTRSRDTDVYVKRWLRTRHAVIFRLSNKTVQVCFFDHTEIILSSEARLVTYTDQHGHRNTYSLKTIMRDPQPELAKRLKYTKDILYQLISIQAERK